MMSKQYKLNSPKFKGKQEGAALLTVMAFLVLMTIVVVSSTKISILDVLISGNEHQKALNIQGTRNDLRELSQTSEIDLAISAGFDSSDQFETADSTDDSEKLITDVAELYPCEAAGSASSMGPSAPPCYIYDFRVKRQSRGSGARDIQHQGGGKMIPNSGSKGSLL